MKIWQVALIVVIGSSGYAQCQNRDPTLSAVKEEIGRLNICLRADQSTLTVLGVAQNFLIQSGYRHALPLTHQDTTYPEALYEWFVADNRPLFQVVSLGDNKKVYVLLFSRKGAPEPVSEIDTMQEIRKRLKLIGFDLCDASSH